jgi:hypothetical protein
MLKTIRVMIFGCFNQKSSWPDLQVFQLFDLSAVAATIFPYWAGAGR